MVGGGIAGVAAAYELRRKGRSVALIEKGRRLGRAVEPQLGLVPGSRTATSGNSPWPCGGSAAGRSSRPRRAAISGFRRTGLVYATDRPGDLAAWERWGEQARSFQMQSRMLSGAEAEAMTPGSRGGWIGGVHSPTDGRAEPSLAVPALAEAARAIGVTIHQGCAVRGLPRRGRAAQGRRHRARARAGPMRCWSPAGPGPVS